MPQKAWRWLTRRFTKHWIGPDAINGWGKAEILKQIAKVKVRPVDEFALHQVTRLDPDLAFPSRYPCPPAFACKLQRNAYFERPTPTRHITSRQLEQWVGD